MKRKGNGKGKGGNVPTAGGRLTMAEAQALKEARVKHLQLMIATGRYVTGVTPMMLSRPADPTLPEDQRGWGISADRVEKLASEAAARQRERLAGDDIVRVATISTLEYIRARAIENEDWKNGVTATMAIHGIVGKHLGADFLAGGQSQQPQVININNILPQGALAAAQANAGGTPTTAPPTDGATPAPDATAPPPTGDAGGSK